MYTCTTTTTSFYIPHELFLSAIEYFLAILILSWPSSLWSNDDFLNTCFIASAKHACSAQINIFFNVSNFWKIGMKNSRGIKYKLVKCIYVIWGWLNEYSYILCSFIFLAKKKVLKVPKRDVLSNDEGVKAYLAEHYHYSNETEVNLRVFKNRICAFVWYNHEKRF